MAKSGIMGKIMAKMGKNGKKIQGRFGTLKQDIYPCNEDYEECKERLTSNFK